MLTKLITCIKVSSILNIIQTISESVTALLKSL